jgi:hypothetical protein
VKYILLMTVDDSYWKNLTPEQMQPMLEAMETYNQSLRDAGVWVQGEGLEFASDAKTVRVDGNGGRTVTAGTFDDAKEQVGGLWIIECPNIDDAVEWAKRVPMSTGGIEVRGLIPPDAF